MSISSLLASGAWVDYAIVLGFVAVGVILVLHFTGVGAKRWGAIGAIVAGGGLALALAGRRRRALEKKLRKETDMIGTFRSIVDESSKHIAQTSRELMELETKRARVDTSTEEGRQRSSERSGSTRRIPWRIGAQYGNEARSSSTGSRIESFSEASTSATVKPSLFWQGRSRRLLPGGRSMTVYGGCGESSICLCTKSFKKTSRH